jgi:chromosome partitioning protein
VDFDPQGHASLGLGVTPGEHPNSVYDLLTAPSEKPLKPEDVVIPLSDRLHLLPSDVMLSAAEPVLLGREHREYCLADILEGIAGRYDFVVIDCPPNIGILTFNALFACSEAIIPIETGMFALHGLARLMETVRLVNSKRMTRITVNALLTMFDRRTRIANESLNEIQKHLGEQVFCSIINFNVRIKEAASHGKPVIEYAPDSKGARDYMSLATELLRMKPRKQAMAKKAEADGPEAGREVLFSFNAPGAETVSVVADFNEWNIGHTPLQHIEGSGMWQKLVPLKKGRYEYKFFVDGRWVTDPANPKRTRNEFGENSLLEVD